MVDVLGQSFAVLSYLYVDVRFNLSLASKRYIRKNEQIFFIGKIYLKEMSCKINNK